MSLRASNATGSGRQPARRPGPDDERAPFPRDDVGGGDDDTGSGHPAAPRDPEPAGDADDPDDARLRRPEWPGCSRSPPPAARPESQDRRSTGRGRRGRARSTASVEGRCRPAVAAPPSAGRSAAASADRARAARRRRRPRRGRARRRLRGRARPALSNARSGGKRRPDLKNDPAIEPSAFEHECPDHRSGKPDQRRVRRVGAAGQQHRRRPRAEHGTCGDTRDRERARKKTPAEPDEAGERDEAERDPVEPSHAPEG